MHTTHARERLEHRKPNKGSHPHRDTGRTPTSPENQTRMNPSCTEDQAREPGRPKNKQTSKKGQTKGQHTHHIPERKRGSGTIGKYELQRKMGNDQPHNAHGKNRNTSDTRNPPGPRHDGTTGEKFPKEFDNTEFSTSRQPLSDGRSGVCYKQTTDRAG